MRLTMPNANMVNVTCPIRQQRPWMIDVYRLGVDTKWTWNSWNCGVDVTLTVSSSLQYSLRQPKDILILRIKFGFRSFYKFPHTPLSENLNSIHLQEFRTRLKTDYPFFLIPHKVLNDITDERGFGFQILLIFLHDLFMRDKLHKRILWWSKRFLQFFWIHPVLLSEIFGREISEFLHDFDSCMYHAFGCF